MAEILTLTGGGTEITFDDAPFVLEEIDFGAAPCMTDSVSKRSVKICGYIISEGETDGERGDYLREKRALLCKAVMADGGFVIERGGRQLSAKAAASPEFSSDAAFSGSDADRFTVRAEAERLFLAPSELAVFGGTVESGATEGTVALTNPGDVPCGCIIEISYTNGALGGMTLALGDEKLTFISSEAGESSVAVDTRRGKKAVRASGGMHFEMIDRHSDMLSVPCGTSSLDWSATAEGVTAVKVTLTPEYYAR